MQEIRNKIDAIDNEMRQLILNRLDLSHQVAEAKQASGNLNIYRADREQAILDRISDGVDGSRKAEICSIMRKIMETSRMYQYGLIYDWNEGIFDTIEGSGLCNHPGSELTIRLTRVNKPNAMSAILAMVGDYGFNMKLMELLEETPEAVTFDLTIRGDISQIDFRKLIFQLSREALEVKILANN